MLNSHFKKLHPPPPKILTSFQLYQKNGAFHVGVLLRKGQERPGDSGGVDLFQAQKGIVMLRGDRGNQEAERNEKGPQGVTQ